MCYSFNDITKFKYFNFDIIDVDEKQSQNFLIYNILYKTLIGVKLIYINKSRTGRPANVF